MIFVTKYELYDAIKEGFNAIYGVESFKKRVKVVFENKKKRVFGVKLDNGETITVHCAPNDTWDSEKALLACYVKYINDNSGKFNELFGLLDNVVKTEKGEAENDN